jgi:hypothetical protein
MNTEMRTVTNPYPEWQCMAGETSCWNCYVLLWRREQVERHLCDRCHDAGLTAREEHEER